MISTSFTKPRITSAPKTAVSNKQVNREYLNSSSAEGAIAFLPLVFSASGKLSSRSFTATVSGYSDIFDNFEARGKVRTVKLTEFRASIQ
ncbi:MAG: hypothetical protein M3209_05950 [Acidobacteriota bacterium]|nr:hypothetical protein [Acidobacteriota bacterium]